MNTDFKLLNKNGVLSNLAPTSNPISNYTDYLIPIIYLTGSTKGMTKDVAVTLNYIYKEFSGTCTLKWQGSSSVNCPKKNYTIKFDKELEIVSSWGLQKKYVLKANFVDSSHARNIVCAKLWGQIVKSRSPQNDRLNALPNGGAIDGFPIIVSLNGEFHGLYTWNIPKDDWMFGMDGTGQQAIVCAEYNNNGAVVFKGLATLTADSNGQLDFDLEYSSDGQLDWVVTSLNRLISAVKDSDGTNITYTISKYVDLESAIDYYCHAVLTGNYDGLQRNYLLATYDGIKWFFTGYDMDVVLGLRAMGKYFYPANHESMSFTTIAGTHKLFYLIWKYMRPQLRTRFEELRATVMSVENVTNMFVDFIADIPLIVYVDDNKKWNSIPSTSANNIAQIITYYDLRCRNADKWIASTTGQTTMPEQVNPNAPTLASISATYTGGNVTVGTPLTDLTGLTVKATYSDGSTSNVTGYSLNGEIAEGANTITVTYEGITTTFTVTGVVEYTYTNQIPISVDANGNIYNGVGYKDDCRISSSGEEKEVVGRGVTGFIQCKALDIIRFKSNHENMITWTDNPTQHSAFNFYDYNKNHLGQFTSQPAYYGIFTASDKEAEKVTKSGDVWSYTVPNNNDIAWFRMTVGTHGGAEIASTSNLIITVNEEIK